MKNANEPISPVLTQSASLQNETSLGLTKREYFAGLAMQAIIPNWNLMKGVERAAVADIAVEMADSLLRQLENTK
ncbi:hypothetical protein HZP39_04200 [Elizabethkingia anophelis]|nr:hypothetical protein [Elizabethkingia anophelis]MCT4239426.1 hypothetical protein [Elizabethkingia anophelis]MCT4282003.1 hypothetical protein [Elizabethkingia anophelis]MCT4292588.1 hypothetical protein [Elizabethkingia anophelis]